MKYNKIQIAVITGIVLSLFLMIGCEDADTASVLVITPSSSEVSGIGATVMLKAGMGDALSVSNRSNQMILPLSWSVSNPSLGGIMSSRGYSAVYESRGKVGQNVVFVKDNYGREGLAVINQK